MTMDDLDKLAQSLADGGHITDAVFVALHDTSKNELVRRLAEIEDELERIGANRLLAEKEKVRDELKKRMVAESTLDVKDETSGYSAKATPSWSDVWHVDKLEPVLTPTQRKRCITKSVDIPAVNDLIKLGALSRAALEAAGAVTKKLRSVSLRVGKAKDIGDDPLA